MSRWNIEVLRTRIRSRAYSRDLRFIDIAYVVMLLWFFGSLLLWLDSFSIDWEIIVSLITGAIGIGLTIFSHILKLSERVATMEQAQRDSAMALRDIKDQLRNMPCLKK